MISFQEATRELLRPALAVLQGQPDGDTLTHSEGQAFVDGLLEMVAMELRKKDPDEMASDVHARLKSLSLLLVHAVFLRREVAINLADAFGLPGNHPLCVRWWPVDNAGGESQSA